MSTTIDALKKAALGLGYRRDAILKDYAFSDFASATSAARRVPLAIFTHTPASYRSAAFGAAYQSPDGVEATVRQFAALGAPLFFVISDDRVGVWQVYADGPPRLIETARADDLASLFEARRTVWMPEAIHRAKSIGRVETAFQLDFVDAGLLPAIEGQIHEKLDRLLSDALASTNARSTSANARSVFQGVFRLMAAKILSDREHPSARAWDTGDVQSVLAGIGSYYGLAVADFQASTAQTTIFHQKTPSLDITNDVAIEVEKLHQRSYPSPRRASTPG